MKTACCKGLDVVIGAAADSVGADDGKYLVVHIDNPEGLVAKEKGSGTAWAAMTLVPEYVTNTIYETVADQLRQQFKEKGSTVTVNIVQTPPKGQDVSSDLKGGILLGILLSALGYGAVKLAGKGF